MIEGSAAWDFLEADCLTMKGAGGRSFVVHVYPQRNGVLLSTNVLSLAPRHPNDPRPRLEALLVASLLYAGWPKHCAEMFGKGRVLEHGPNKGNTVHSWSSDAACRMMKAVEKVLREDPTLEYHPQIDVLAANVRAKLRTSVSPLELHMADLMGPLKASIAKGATREDLHRIVDECFVEGVMKV
jgi:hypothetical protein